MPLERATTPRTRSTAKSAILTPIAQPIWLDVIMSRIVPNIVTPFLKAATDCRRTGGARADTDQSARRPSTPQRAAGGAGRWTARILSNLWPKGRRDGSNQAEAAEHA